MKRIKFLVLAFALAIIPSVLFAQNKNISGKVTSVDGEPVAGAYVLVKDSTKMSFDECLLIISWELNNNL